MPLTTRSLRCTTMLMLLALLGGCATQLESLRPGAVTEKHQISKNYEVGVSRTVSVGDAVVKFHDYWLETTESPVMVPDKSVIVEGGSLKLPLNAGSRYPVRGGYTISGIPYTVVAVNENPSIHHALLIAPDGSIHSKGLFTHPQVGGYIEMVISLTPSDPSVRLARETKESVTAKKGYENYEILYTGSTSNSMNFTYREFSPEGMARVAFFQNLTYEANAKSVAFKKYRIAIEKADSESITYKVLQDGR